MQLHSNTHPVCFIASASNHLKSHQSFSTPKGNSSKTKTVLVSSLAACLKFIKICCHTKFQPSNVFQRSSLTAHYCSPIQRDTYHTSSTIDTVMKLMLICTTINLLNNQLHKSILWESLLQVAWHTLLIHLSRGVVALPRTTTTTTV